MKKILLFIVFLFIALPACAEVTQQIGETPQTPPATFSLCQKTFIKQSEPFFYIVLSSIAKNNYKIEEIQSKNGLIIFKVYNKEFLANITKVDFKTTLLKITPVDNSYNFPYSIVENLFKTIETDLWQDIYKLN